ncbi:MAG: XRE family transcriptional regulator [Candidatus Kapaibacterium sp.]|nr:ImmA/IrrE family metallo-endopeptidase [Ignavibacteria bacterium]
MKSQNLIAESFTIARQYRGMTQKEVAEGLNVSQTTISKIELGFQLPTPELLTTMAEFFKLPESFFYKKLTEIHPGLKYHRKRKNVPAKVLGQFDAALTIIRGQLIELLKVVEVSDSIYKIFDPTAYDSPVLVAQALREAAKQPRGPINNLIEFAEDLGLIVLLLNVETPAIDGVTFSLGFEFSPPVIVLNKNMPMDRLRFTLAHEIGHAIMHLNQQFREEFDDEANRFASELLMPEEDIYLHLTAQPLSIQRLVDLKRYWHVSMQSLIERAYRLDIINESERTRLYIAMSRRGYRKKEPIEIPRETPTLAQEMIETTLVEALAADNTLLRDMMIHEVDELYTMYSIPQRNRIQMKVLNLPNNGGHS